jgi:hypothetical protein
MKRIPLSDMTVEQLVERFVADGLAQYQAELYNKHSKYNRLYDEMVVIERELKSRYGDQRIALVPLLNHSNPQVRFTAAQSTLVVAPAASRQALQDLSDRNIYPQAADARGTLWALERGDRKPT